MLLPEFWQELENVYITPVLQKLNWLPVCHRINFKILLLVLKSINGSAPSYLSDLLTAHQPTRALRSANVGLLIVPRSRLKTRGDRAFSIAAPRLWNNLPLEIKTAPSIFKVRLKTFLFDVSYRDECWCSCFVCMHLLSCCGPILALCIAHWSTKVVFSCAL